MAIDGSVHETGTFLEVKKNYFSPKFEEYMQKERLNWSRFKYHFRYPDFGWVFWSQQDHQTQLDNYAGLIRHALQRVSKEEFWCRLVQFWAPTKTAEGRTLLTTQFQPFALGSTLYTDDRNRLCEYRMGMCREYNNSFYADAECPQEQQLGLPGRVFLHRIPESTPAVEYYSPKEYPQRDLALRCGIKSSWALPVFHNSTHTCIGVIEIVSLLFMLDEIWHLESFLDVLYDVFQEFGLLCFDGYKHYEMQIRDENKVCTTAFQELKTVLEMVCKIHELPLAMTWVPCSACNDLLQGQLNSTGVKFCQRWNYYTDTETSFWLRSFEHTSKSSHLIERGVAGMVLSSRNMLYCSDITQLSLVEYPLVLYARLCELRGWFTICLQSNYTANDVYVLELFLPTSKRYRDYSWTLLSLILGTMKENFRTFKLASGQELGDSLSVEVLDFQNGQKLHSVQNIQANVGGVMLQLRHPASMGSIHCGSNVVSEDQNGILPSLEAVQNQEVTMQLDSSHQPPLDPPNNGQNIIIEERNMVTIKARYGKYTIRFRLSSSPRLVELQQEVAKRLNLEAGTYYITYIDVENEVILIACDDDLQDCIENSRSLGNTSIVVLLQPKQPMPT